MNTITRCSVRFLFAKKDFCDFVVWTEVDYHYERIEPDVEFWSEALEHTFINRIKYKWLVPSPIVYSIYGWYLHQSYTVYMAGTFTSR